MLTYLLTIGLCALAFGACWAVVCQAMAHEQVRTER